MPRLENWSVIGKRLIGHVFDDARFSDGDLVYTTEIISINLEQYSAQTKNTLYNLGKPYESDALNNGGGTVCVRDEQNHVYPPILKGEEK